MNVFDKNVFDKTIIIFNKRNEIKVFIGDNLIHGLTSVSIKHNVHSFGHFPRVSFEYSYIAVEPSELPEIDSGDFMIQYNHGSSYWGTILKYGKWRFSGIQKFDFEFDSEARDPLEFNMYCDLFSIEQARIPITAIKEVYNNKWLHCLDAYLPEAFEQLAFKQILE